MAETPIVELRNVSVRYGDVPALEDINLTVLPHDFLGIIGPNGGGKSTLLRVILGLVSPDSGVIKVMGESPERSRRFVGYVAQRPAFDRDFPASVWDVVLMGRCGLKGLFNRYDGADAAAAADALVKVGMQDMRDRQIGRLSGGEQQRVFIARALAAEPKLLLLDEPLSSVDPSVQTGLYELLADLRRSLTVVIVSHDIGAVSVHVDSIACLNRRLFHHGSSELSADVLEATYQCPVQLIAHGQVPHRVLKDH